MSSLYNQHNAKTINWRISMTEQERIQNEALLAEIESARKSLHTDVWKMGLLELLSMVEKGELVVKTTDSPIDVKWGTNFIETILLGLNTPQFIVRQNSSGKWLMVDGNKRMLLLLSFFGIAKNPDGSNHVSNKWLLEQGCLIPLINGLSIDTLHLKNARLIQFGKIDVVICRADKSKAELIHNMVSPV